MASDKVVLKVGADAGHDLTRFYLVSFPPPLLYVLGTGNNATHWGLAYLADSIDHRVAIFTIKLGSSGKRPESTP